MYIRKYSLLLDLKLILMTPKIMFLKESTEGVKRMTGTEGIQIYVACHKPTWVLDNRLLVPVQVGAALTDARYAGMRQDNEGEHISEKMLSTAN